MSSGKPTPYAELISVLENLPILLREARRARGVGKQATAIELGVSVATVTRIEEGKGMMLFQAMSILKWLDKAPDGYAP